MASDAVVMGGGAVGRLAAAYLQKRFPALGIAVVEGPRKNRPIVGEPFVELTIDFLIELGPLPRRELYLTRSARC